MLSTLSIFSLSVTLSNSVISKSGCAVILTLTYSKHSFILTLSIKSSFAASPVVRFTYITILTAPVLEAVK